MEASEGELEERNKKTNLIRKEDKEEERISERNGRRIKAHTDGGITERAAQ